MGRPKGGGKIPGSGRKKGVLNKRTIARQQALLETAGSSDETPNAFTGDSLALFRAVYKNPGLDVHVRLDAAKAAAPYEHPKLATILPTAPRRSWLEDVVLSSYEQESKVKSSNIATDGAPIMLEAVPKSDD